MDFADVAGYFHIRALDLGKTVHITAPEEPQGGIVFFVVVKSPIHSPRRTCIVCQMSRKIYALVRHFSKKILLTMDLAVLSSCGPVGSRPFLMEPRC